MVVVMLFPFYLIIINAFKDFQEIVMDAIAFPTRLYFGNFAEAFYRMRYPVAFMNTLTVTVLGTAGIVLAGSLAGYQIARDGSALSKVLFFLLIIPMMIPFQSFMLSLVRVASGLNLLGSIWGLSIIYWGCGVPMAIFLYRGFVLGVPKELDEAATIDGCNAFRAFFLVIFPILKPVNATVVIINAMWLWNDFLLPRLIIGANLSHNTLQLQAVQFRGMYRLDWNLIMSGFLITLLPALIIYLIFQKQIVKGMVTGAVKG